MIMCYHATTYFGLLSDAQVGLEELTSDIGKLVNLKVLTLEGNYCITHIPESISCLQKLENLCIDRSPIENWPAVLGPLTSLTSLGILWNGELEVHLNIQVIHC